MAVVAGVVKIATVVMIAAGVEIIAARVGIVEVGVGITFWVSVVAAVPITEFNPSAWNTCSIATSYY